MKWWDRAFDIPSEGLVHTTELKMKYETLSPEDFYKRPECKIAHDTDKQGVLDADILLFVADDEPKSFNGANVELGMADAWDKPRFCIGKLGNSALYHGMIWCKSVEELLILLNPETYYEPNTSNNSFKCTACGYITKIEGYDHEDQGVYLHCKELQICEICLRWGAYAGRKRMADSVIKKIKETHK